MKRRSKSRMVPPTTPPMIAFLVVEEVDELLDVGVLPVEEDPEGSGPVWRTK